MAATGFRSEVGTVEMCAQDAGAAGTLAFQPPTHLEKCKMLLMPGHCGSRQQAGRAVPGVSLADSANRVGGTVHEVGAGPAVDMKVHKAWNKITALDVNGVCSG